MCCVYMYLFIYLFIYSEMCVCLIQINNLLVNNSILMSSMWVVRENVHVHVHDDRKREKGKRKGEI